MRSIMVLELSVILVGLATSCVNRSSLVIANSSLEFREFGARVLQLKSPIRISDLLLSKQALETIISKWVKKSMSFGG